MRALACARSVHSRWAERSGRFHASGSSRESGRALVWPPAPGGLTLDARAEGELLLQEPADPEPLLAAAAGVDRARVQCATLISRLHPADGRALRCQRHLAFATLAVSGARSELRRSRIATRLAEGELRDDAEALLRARSLAAIARERPTPPAMVLAAPVAAALLGILWECFRGPRHLTLPEPPAVELIDDARPEGGPLGEPFDAAGRPARQVVLAGAGAEPPEALAPRRLSFAEPATPGLATNLQLRARFPSPDEPLGPARVLAIEERQPGTDRAGRVALVLLAETPDGAACRFVTRIDLPTLLGSISGAGAALYRTPAASSPWLLVGSSR